MGLIGRERADVPRPVWLIGRRPPRRGGAALTHPGLKALLFSLFNILFSSKGRYNEKAGDGRRPCRGRGQQPKTGLARRSPALLWALIAALLAGLSLYAHAASALAALLARRHGKGEGEPAA